MRRAAWIGAVLLAGLAWRLAYLAQIRRAPFFSFNIGDAAAYDAWAREIAGGDWLGHGVFYQAPLYPYLLGCVYATLGDGRFTVALVQCLLGAGACALMCDAGWRWFSKPTGIVAGGLSAVYAPAIFFDGLIQKSSLDLCLTAVVLWLCSHLVREPRRRTALGLGLASGLLALNRENALVLALLIGVWLLLFRRSAARARLALAVSFALGLGLVLLPVAARNRAVSGELHLTTFQFGTNLYIGNHAGADGRYVPLSTGHGDAAHERADAVRMAQAAAGRELSPAEVSRYWTREVVRFVVDDPLAWLELMLRKTALFWNDVELTDTEDVYTYSDYAAALRVPGRWLSFGVLAVLGVVGCCASWSRRAELSLLLALVPVYTASVVLFFVSARYRLPIVPVVTLFAAEGLVGCRRFVRGSTWPRIAACALGASAMAVVAFWPLVDRERLQTASYLNFGAELHDRGRWSEAAELFERVVARSPNLAEAHYNLGASNVALGRLERAAACFERAVEIAPRFVLATLQLGNMQLELGHSETAMGWFRRTLELDETQARAHYGLGRAHLEQGRPVEALPHFERAVALEPGFLPASQGLEAARAAARVE